MIQKYNKLYMENKLIKLQFMIKIHKIVMVGLLQCYKL